jgi:recombination protein RecA
MEKSLFETGSALERIKDLASTSKIIYPTGICTLDAFLSGGIHSGKIYEIFGQESSGKSTLALHFARAYLDYWKENAVVLWIESESAFDYQRAVTFGIDLSKVLIYEVDVVEDGFDKIEKILKKAEQIGKKVFIVWDTIAACSTMKEKQDGQFGGGISEKARAIRSLLRKVTTQLGRTDSVLLFVNQVYDVIGSYSNEVESPGGRGIKFHASARIFIERKAQIKKMVNGMEIPIGIKSKLTLKKNKLGLPGLSTMLVIYGEKGVDKWATLSEFLKQLPEVKKSASWFTINLPDGSSIKFQNEKQLKVKVEENPELDEFFRYLAFKYYANLSMFMKVKFYDWLIEIERKWYGKPITQLTEEEEELYDLLKEAQNEDNT